MANYTLPTNVGSGTSTGHYSHTNTVHAFLDKFDTTVQSGGTTGQVLKHNGTGWAPGTDLSAAGGTTNTADHIMFVSKAGNDANNGLGWGSAKLTLGAAMASFVSDSSDGIIYMGAGTFVESPGLSSENVMVIGAGIRA